MQEVALKCKLGKHVFKGGWNWLKMMTKDMICYNVKYQKD
jgi:hypothetical protein